MSLKSLVASSAGILLLASVSVAQADTSKADTYKADAYKAGQFLLLDLKQAVLSPKLLGPPASFQHVQIEAKADSKNEIDAAADKPRSPVQKAVPVAKPKQKLAVQPKPPARSRVGRARSNPLDANARDTRVQVWPCRTGGICNWQTK